MQGKKIIITGGPGTGKSSIIQLLEKKGFRCLPEVSREIILEAKEKGISQLFLEDPLLFSKMLLEKRIEQYHEAESCSQPYIFIDRGIPDVVAYLDYIESTHPPVFSDSCKNHIYDMIFLLPPWKEIYTCDNERYESFDQAVKIHTFLVNTYKDLGYEVVEVPHETLENRVHFILEKMEE
ncbi:MAG TPA: ATP-binding protein [Salinimicrobium sp.]|nr:ATP-binding protein [Salinimicrobium sp.]